MINIVPIKLYIVICIDLIAKNICSFISVALVMESVRWKFIFSPWEEILYHIYGTSYE